MRRIGSALSALSVAAAMTAACAEESTSAAEAAAGAHYEYREKVMESIGANMGAIGDIMKNKLPHQANIAVHARTIQLAAGGEELTERRLSPADEALREAMQRHFAVVRDDRSAPQ